MIYKLYHCAFLLSSFSRFLFLLSLLIVRDSFMKFLHSHWIQLSASLRRQRSLAIDFRQSYQRL